MINLILFISDICIKILIYVLLVSRIKLIISIFFFYSVVLFWGYLCVEAIYLIFVVFLI